VGEPEGSPLPHHGGRRARLKRVAKSQRKGSLAGVGEGVPLHMQADADADGGAGAPDGPKRTINLWR
jgi:hypothetical protein